jgi:cytochrome c5
VSWREREYQFGRDIYERVCASCHDQPNDGAPTIRDRESWADRSPLWSSVLFEHAKNGYMEMQAKGGAELSDRDVEAAGEFMLSETFPELPRD